MQGEVAYERIKNLTRRRESVEERKYLIRRLTQIKAVVEYFLQ